MAGYSFKADDPTLHIQMKVFGFCYCGNPYVALEHVLAVLRTIKERHDHLHEVGNYTQEEYDAARQRWYAAAGGYAPYLFTLYWLDSKGFIDHGGSVEAPWWIDETETLYNDLVTWEDDDAAS